MTVPFHVYTRETLEVVSPFDPAVTGDAEQRKRWAQREELPRPVDHPGATVFMLRGLSPMEVRKVGELGIANTPPEVLARWDAMARTKEGEQFPPEALALTPEQRLQDGMCLAFRMQLWVRFALVGITANPPEGWPSQDFRFAGRAQWSTSTLEGLEPATVQWLGLVARELTHPVDAKKKRSSGC